MFINVSNRARRELEEPKTVGLLQQDTLGGTVTEQEKSEAQGSLNLAEHWQAYVFPCPSEATRWISCTNRDLRHAILFGNLQHLDVTPMSNITGDVGYTNWSTAANGPSSILPSGSWASLAPSPQQFSAFIFMMMARSIDPAWQRSHRQLAGKFMQYAIPSKEHHSERKCTFETHLAFFTIALMLLVVIRSG